MVDFQSRDTRRGTENSEAADGEDAAGDERTEPEAEGAADRDDESASTPEEDRPDPGVAVVTVANGRSIERDPAGDAVVEEIDRSQGHVVTRELIGSSFDGVQRTVDSLVDRRDVSTVVTVGGTGVEPEDVTVEAVRQMFDKELPGFGELFRRSCEEQVGAAAIRTRATAGVMDGVVCFSMPGDPDLARTGTRDLVAPEADYLAALADDRTDDAES